MANKRRKTPASKRDRPSHPPVGRAGSLGVGLPWLPGASDFCNPDSQDPDERHALKSFLGKTREEALAMFQDNFLCYQEDLTYMRGPAFRFYVEPAMDYLLSDKARGDSDAVNCFCGVLELRLEFSPQDLKPIADRVRTVVQQILDTFDRYDCHPNIYGNVPSRYQTVLAKLT